MQISPHFGIFSVFRFPFPFRVPVLVPCSRFPSPSGFLFRCDDAQVHRCARAPLPMGWSADAPCATGIQGADQIQISPNFYAIEIFQSAEKFGPKLNFSAIWINTHRPGFEPTPGPVPSLYHLRPWPVHFFGIFCFLHNFWLPWSFSMIFYQLMRNLKLNIFVFCGDQHFDSFTHYIHFFVIWTTKGVIKFNIWDPRSTCEL